jgi:hypothetical protein
MERGAMFLYASGGTLAIAGQLDAPEDAQIFSGWDSGLTLGAYDSPSGYAEKKTVTPNQFGAHVDGWNDDKPHIDQALAALHAGGGGRLRLLPGNAYICKTTLTFPTTPIVVEGAYGVGLNIQPACLNCTARDGTAGVKIDGTSRGDSGFAMRNVYILGNDDVVEEGDVGLGPCLHVYNGSRYEFDNVYTYKGSQGIYIEDAYINKFESCKAYYAVGDGIKIDGNYNTFRHCQTAGNRAWGIHVVGGVTNKWLGDISNNALGGIWHEAGLQNTFSGYYEPTSGGNARTMLKVDSPSSFSVDASDVWGGSACSDVIDNGINTRAPLGSGVVGRHAPDCLVTNQLPGSSFSAAADILEYYEVDAAKSDITHEPADGVSTGTSMKLAALSTSMASAGKLLYVADMPVAGDVFLITGWVKASTAMYRGTLAQPGFSVDLTASVGNGTRYPDNAQYPYADTSWRRFSAYFSVTTSFTSGLYLFLSITQPQIGDWIKVTDLMLIKNPPKGIDPLSIPYVSTPSGSTRTAKIQAIPAQLNEKVRFGGDGSTTGQLVTWASAAPTSGTWTVGSIVYNSAPSSGAEIGWVCTNASGAGTWSVICPDAGASAAGKVSTGTQTLAGAKTFSTSVTSPLFTQTAGGWDDLSFQLTGLSASAGTTPVMQRIMDATGTGSTAGVFGWGFLDSREDDLVFNAQMPHSYKVGSDIKAHVHWTMPTTTTGTVRWGLEYAWANTAGNFRVTAPASTKTSLSGNVATITFGATHGLKVGQNIVVSDADEGTYDGNHRITAVVDTGGVYTISYAVTHADIAEAADTGVVVYGYTIHIEANEVLGSDSRWKHIVTDLGTIAGSRAGTDIGISNVLLCRFYRPVLEAHIAERVPAIAIDFHYQKDGFGSSSETSK